MQSTTRSVVTWAASLVVILNLIDAIFTMAYTSAGVAVEANPLMDVTLAKSPVLFVLVKTTIVSLGVFLLWRLRHRRAAVVGMMSTTAVYCMLLFYHLSGTTHLLAATR